MLEDSLEPSYSRLCISSFEGSYFQHLSHVHSYLSSILFLFLLHLLKIEISDAQKITKMKDFLVSFGTDDDIGSQ